MTRALRAGVGAIVAHVLLFGMLGQPGWCETAAKPAAAEDQADDLWTRETLLGDFAGLRPFLAAYGAKLDIVEISEALGNPTGGRRRGALYEGLTDLALTIDLKPYFNAPGTVFARAYQIHGRGLTAGNLGNLAPVSGIEATRTTRLFELWYQLPLSERLQLRLGQQAAGTEFLISTTAQLFVNATFGWPNLPALDLPSGGPTYPLATPGVRLKASPTEEVTLLLGLYNGDPAGPGAGDPQLRDASGTAFRINDGAFLIAEARYNPGNSEGNGTYRLGGWFHSERFPDQRLDTNGMPLSSPASSGTPRQHRHNTGLYAIVDQPILRNGDDGGATFFARVMGAPSDRNLVDFYFDVGLAYAGPFGRKDDKVGIGVGYTRIGSAARELDADAARLAGQPNPVRSGELVVEVTYRMQLAPWWQLQPDFQYVVNPGGGILDPNRPGRRLGDAAVLGLRTQLTF
jgi:porin